MAKKAKAKKAAKRKTARKPARKAASKKTAARRKSGARRAARAKRSPAKKKRAAPRARPARAGANEGEGSKSADRAYREAATRFGETHDTAAMAEQAAREVDSDPETYEDAMEEGRSHSAGDLPEDEF
jgi:hypothetical protein